MNDQPCNEDSDPNTGSTTNEESGLETDLNLTTNTSSSSGSRSLDADAEIATFEVQFQGPLPSPGMLESFDRIVPGLARKIVDRSELELQHRHRIEQQALAAKIEDQKAERVYKGRGQWMAFVLCMVLISIGSIAAFTGHGTVASVIFGTTVIGVVTVFVVGRAQKEKREKL